MCKIVKAFVFALLLISFTAAARNNPPLTKQHSRIQTKTYTEKQKFFNRQIQKYWQLSPDTAVWFADQAIKLADSAGSLKDLSKLYVMKGIGYYYQGKNKKAVNCFHASVNYAKQSDYDKILGNAFTMLSLVHRNLGNYDSAVYYGKQSLKIRTDKVHDSADIGGSYDNLATIYQQIGNYEASIDYSLKAEKIFSKLNNLKELAYVYGNLSNLYELVQDRKNHLRYIKKTVRILKKLNDKEGYADAINNLGLYFLKYHQPDSAMFYLKQASTIYSRTKHLEALANVKTSIGEIYMLENNIKEADKYLTQACQQQQLSGKQNDLFETLILLAEVNIRKKKFQMAKKFLQQADTIESKLKNPHLKLKLLNKYEKLYEKIGKPLEAIILLKEIQQQKDSLNRLEVRQKIAEITTRYQTEKVLMENKKLKQKQLLEEIKNKDLHIITLVLVLVFVLAIIIATMLVQKKRKASELSKQKLLLMQKEEELMKADLEKAALKQDELNHELEHNSKQLATFTLQMMQKNLILQDVLKEIKTLEKTDGRLIKKNLVNLKIQIINALSSDTDWDTFKYFFEKVNTGFFNKLQLKYPGLSGKDLKLCALTSLNMSIDETASVLNIESNSVRIARYRLRKKMKLSPEESLYEALTSL